MAAFVAPIVSGLLGGLGGLFGGGKQQDVKSSQNTSTSQNQNFSNTGSVTPDLNPFQQQLAGMFTQGAMNQYGQATNLAPYTSQGLQQIQGQGSQNSQAIRNAIASRGLSFSPAATNAQTQNTLNTGNQMNSFLQGVPLLQQQLQQQKLQQLMQAFGVQPFGTTSMGSGQASSTGTSSMTGTNIQSGNPTAGAIGGAGATLFAPGGLFGAGGPWGSLGSGIGKNPTYGGGYDLGG